MGARIDELRVGNRCGAEVSKTSRSEAAASRCSVGIVSSGDGSDSSIATSDLVTEDVTSVASSSDGLSGLRISGPSYCIGEWVS